MGRGILCGLVLAVLLLAPLACASWRAARLYTSGTEALDRGELALAITDLEQAASLVPAASEVQNHLGLAYLAAGRGDDALAAFQGAIDRDCENDAARRNLVAARRAHSLGERVGASPGDHSGR
jgi:lipoprotein NlpI